MHFVQLSSSGLETNLFIFFPVGLFCLQQFVNAAQYDIAILC